MMVSNTCFVPGCKSGYKSDRKKRKSEGKKCPSLFGPPRTDDKLQKWRNAISRSDREMGINDKVCELHFLPNEISKSSVMKLSDGTDIVIERKNPILIADAVPSLFPNSSSYFNQKRKCRKPPCERLPLAKKSRRSSKTEEILIVNETVTNEILTIEDTVTRFTFSELLANITKVFKPNKWWSVSSHEDFVVCVKWNAKFAPERQVIIDNNLCVKVMYYGTEITVISDKVVQSIEHLSAILGNIDGHLFSTSIKHGLLSKNVYQMHLKENIVHMDGNEYHCNIIPESTFSENDLKGHLLVNKERIKLHCNVCRMEFSDKTELERHYPIHKAESISLNEDSFNHIEKSSFACLLCNETFSHKCLLEKHPFSLTGSQLSCPFCSKFIEKKELKMHLQLHTKKKSKMPKRHFVCNICKEEFQFRIALKCHIKVHQDKEKSLDYNKCDNVFSNSHSLSKNLRLSSKKKFSCDTCTSVFTSKMALINHKKRVHIKKTV